MCLCLEKSLSKEHSTRFSTVELDLQMSWTLVMCPKAVCLNGIWSLPGEKIHVYECKVCIYCLTYVTELWRCSFPIFLLSCSCCQNQVDPSTGKILPVEILAFSAPAIMLFSSAALVLPWVVLRYNQLVISGLGTFPLLGTKLDFKYSW